MHQRPTSDKLFDEAKQYLPGGVNSPVRAFRSVDGSPLFFERGEGSHVWDADGNEYIDYCCSWGPLILGHAHPGVLKMVSETMVKGTSFGAPNKLETELAKLIIENHSYLEKIRFVNSGTEAAMSAIRLARGVTGKNKVIKFEGCYHGHVDSLMVKAGSGLATLGTSTSAGIPEAYIKETIVLPLNDEQAVRDAIEEFGDDIACIAIEPVPANNGLLLQDKKFLTFLREICDETGILLFFDEVISGFRLSFEGASGYYGIQPDMIAMGKIIGGGFPVGAYGASAKVMDRVAPDGPVYQAGTLSGNPVAMAAGIAQLKECLQPGFYESLEKKTALLANTVQEYADQENIPFRIFHIASIFWLSFKGDDHVRSATEIDPNSSERYKVFHDSLLQQGVYIAPSSFEVGFVCAAHSEEDILQTAEAMKRALAQAYGR